MARTTPLLLGLTIGAPLCPPATRRDDVRDVLHGVELVDPFRWLEDQQSPETRDWINAQNQHTAAVLGGPETRRAIADRLDALTRADQVTSPSLRRGRYFFYSRAADQELWVYVMRDGIDGEDVVLLDPHTLSPDLSVTTDPYAISDDGKLLIYGIREGGEDQVTPRFMDVDRRQDLADSMPKARYFGFALLPDDRTVYYTRHDETGGRVYRHIIGADPAEDEYVFGEGYGPEQSLGAHTSEDGRWLLLHVYYGAGAKRTEMYIKDLASDGPIVTVVNDIEAQFHGDVVDGRLYVQTDWQAPGSRIMVGDPAHPDMAEWTELVPERSYPLQGHAIIGGRLFLTYLEDVVSRIEVCDLAGTKLAEIRSPSVGSLSGIIGRPSQDEGFYSFSSYDTPGTIHRYQVSTDETTVWSRLSVPFAGDDFVVRQVWFASKDGTRVPMFVAHRHGLPLDGSAPALLTGYGGFQSLTMPGFSARSALWLERGGVFAAPNLRGGGEFGEKWHEAGMLGNKQNVFDDFIAAAEYLIREGYTRPDRLAVAGGSNGGLLVGAAVTQRPDLFGAVVCGCPLLDMARYHRFLLGPLWVSEYGSAENAEDFRYLLAYSPYQNVEPGTAYPAVLFVTGDADTRVDPLHARKMCALLQSATSSGRPVLLHYDTKLGHSGGRPVNKAVEDVALELAFLFRELGCSP